MPDTLAELDAAIQRHIAETFPGALTRVRTMTEVVV